MNAYNYYVSGFVKEVGVKLFGNICLLMGKICHSQKVSDIPPAPWVLTPSYMYFTILNKYMETKQIYIYMKKLIS